MPAQVDFKTLTMQDALDLAVLIEEEARVRYLELADSMAIHDTPSAARFFLYMAGNEEKHRDQLVERRKALFGEEATKIKLEQLFDVEAPEYDEVRAYMSPRAALHVAHRAEEKAEAFFASALEVVRDARVRTLFDELRLEEIEHKKLVAAQLEKTPHEGAITAADVADEPHAE